MFILLACPQSVISLLKFITFFKKIYVQLKVVEFKQICVIDVVPSLKLKDLRVSQITHEVI